jgi:hypothetical protein
MASMAMLNNQGWFFGRFADFDSKIMQGQWLKFNPEEHIVI